MLSCNSRNISFSSDHVTNVSQITRRITVQYHKHWSGGSESFLLVVLAGHPGQSPLEVGEHVLHGLGPLLLTVELGLDGEGVPCKVEML